MAKHSQPGVSFQIGGDVTGGITGNILAGGDVELSGTISIGGKEIPADKDPNVEELRQLLAEIQQEIAEVLSQKEALKEVSSAAPFTVQGAEAVLKEATEKVKDQTDKKNAKSTQEKLTEATDSLGKILEGAEKVTKKTGDVGGALTTLIEKLAPLVKKIGVAAMWVAKLWL